MQTAMFRHRMIEILNSNLFQPPIIVFVNQKKTADMVAKDISKAGVSAFGIFDVVRTTE